MSNSYVCHDCGKLCPGKPALRVRVSGITPEPINLCPRCRPKVSTWEVIEDVEAFVKSNKFVSRSSADA